MKKISLTLSTFFFISIIPASVFDSIEWEKVYESNGISVFIQTKKEKKANYYKAEKTIPWNIASSLYKNILDFNSYPKIFPHTIITKKVKQLEDNKLIVYSCINFKPLKNRDYYMLFVFYQSGKEYIVEWTPVFGLEFEKDAIPEGTVRAENITGKWHIIDYGNKTKISVNIHNDFKFNMPASTLLPYEVTNVAQMLDDLINYTIKKK